MAGSSSLKNKLLDKVGKGDGGMIWEKSMETYTLLYIKQIASGSLMYDTVKSKPMLCDNLEEVGWRGSQEGCSRGRGHMYT